MKNSRKRQITDCGGLPDKQGIPTLCSEERFKFLIERERNRADRGHGIFSLIIFDLPSEQIPPQDRQFIDVIRKRIRMTDSVGWLDNSSLGVLLADAPRTGAGVFVGDVLRLTEEVLPPPEYQILTYPEKFAEGGNCPDFSGGPVGEDITSTEQRINTIMARSPSIARRVCERVVAAFILVMISPSLLLIMLAIKQNSRGPCIYSQMRVGHTGKLFRCYKFRTMHLDADAAVHDTYFRTLVGNDQPMRKLDTTDPRIFTVGRFLRASSLDELPQLFNILKGDMSFIGPRPAIPEEYKDYFFWHRSRVDALPGLTGLWQVNGKNKTTFAEMVRYDISYCRRKSALMDVQIICRTPIVVLGQYLEDRRMKNRAPSSLQKSLACGVPNTSRDSSRKFHSKSTEVK